MATGLMLEIKHLKYKHPTAEIAVGVGRRDERAI